MNNFEDELKELKAIFGVKKLLTPAEVAPILGKSVPVLANLRLTGACPLPVYKIGRSVGFNIRDLAQFLASGSICPPIGTTEKIETPEIRSKSRKSTLTQQKNWILAMKLAINLNSELIESVENEILKVTVKAPTRGKVRSAL